MIPLKNHFRDMRPPSSLTKIVAATVAMAFQATRSAQPTAPAAMTASGIVSTALLHANNILIVDCGETSSEGESPVLLTPFLIEKLGAAGVRTLVLQGNPRFQGYIDRFMSKSGGDNADRQQLVCNLTDDPENARGVQASISEDRSKEIADIALVARRLGIQVALSKHGLASDPSPGGKTVTEIAADAYYPAHVPAVTIAVYPPKPVSLDDTPWTETNLPDIFAVEDGKGG